MELRTKEPEIKTKEDLLAALAKAAVNGRLLLFVGTGFSRAAVPGNNSKGTPTVLSWTSLLREVCVKMKMNPNKYILPEEAEYTPQKIPVKLEKVPNLQYACPAIASKMCGDWERTNAPDKPGTGPAQMKNIIAGLTIWAPLTAMRSRIKSLLKTINPIGIITTNYDTVLESILEIDGKLVEKDDLFIPRNHNQIPIWHIHGSIQAPESIVITQEDYQLFLRPENYAQRKISMLLREYTTLFIGYSLSDANIKTAIDWAMNVYETTGTSNPLQVRLVHEKNDGTVVRDANVNSMYSITTPDCVSFLESLSQSIDSENKQREKTKKALKSVLSGLQGTTETGKRDMKRLAKTISTLRSVLKQPNQNVMFLILPQVQSLLLDAKNRAGEDNNFSAYADWLQILLTLLEEIPQNETPPTLIALLAEELERVLPMTGNHFGQSWDADKLWKREVSKIPKDKIEYYLKLSRQLSLPSLEKKITQAIEESRNPTLME